MATKLSSPRRSITRPADEAEPAVPTIEWAFTCNTLLGTVADGARDRGSSYSPSPNLCGGARWASAEWLGPIDEKIQHRLAPVRGHMGDVYRRMAGRVKSGQIFVVPEAQLPDALDFATTLLTPGQRSDAVSEWSMALVREPGRTRIAVNLPGPLDACEPFLAAFDVEYIVNFSPGDSNRGSPDRSEYGHAQIRDADGTLLASPPGLVLLENEQVPVRLVEMAERHGTGLEVFDKRAARRRTRHRHPVRSLEVPIRSCRRLEDDERSSDHDLLAWRRARIERRGPIIAPPKDRPGATVVAEVRVWAEDDYDNPRALIAHNRVLSTTKGYRAEVDGRLRPKVYASMVECFAGEVALRRVEEHTVTEITSHEGANAPIGATLECVGQGAPVVIIEGVRGHFYRTSAEAPAAWLADDLDSFEVDEADPVGFSVDFITFDEAHIRRHSVSARGFGRYWEVGHPDIDATDEYVAPSAADGFAWAVADAVFEECQGSTVAAAFHSHGDRAERADGTADAAGAAGSVDAVVATGVYLNPWWVDGELVTDRVGGRVRRALRSRPTFVALRGARAARWAAESPVAEIRGGDDGFGGVDWSHLALVPVGDDPEADATTLRDVWIAELTSGDADHPDPGRSVVLVLADGRRLCGVQVDDRAVAVQIARAFSTRLAVLSSRFDRFAFADTRGRPVGDVWELRAGDAPDRGPALAALRELEAPPVDDAGPDCGWLVPEALDGREE